MNWNLIWMIIGIFLIIIVIKGFYTSRGAMFPKDDLYCKERYGYDKFVTKTIGDEYFGNSYLHECVKLDYKNKIVINSINVTYEEMNRWCNPSELKFFNILDWSKNRCVGWRS